MISSVSGSRFALVIGANTTSLSLFVVARVGIALSLTARKLVITDSPFMAGFRLTRIAPVSHHFSTRCAFVCDGGSGSGGWKRVVVWWFVFPAESFSPTVTIFSLIFFLVQHQPNHTTAAPLFR